MQKKFILFSLAAFSIIAVTSCDMDDNNDAPAADEPVGAYIIVATSDEASYILQSADLTKGELTIVNSGLETDNGTEWEFNSDRYLYRLQYNQGNAGTSSSYILNADGQIEERSIAVEIRSRFTTHGSFGKYVVTAAAVATDTKDEAGNAAQGVTFTYIDAEQQTLATKTIVTENFLGNGEYVTFSGVAEVGGKLFTAICPLGVSDYGAARGFGGGSGSDSGSGSGDGSASGSGAAYSGTAFPDSVWIAVFDNTSFSNPRIIRDSRLGYATTRFRSQYYTNLAVDDADNLYVFSSAYEAETTRPSGVLRIKSGAETFDPSFFFDIEQAAEGRHLYKVFYIAKDYFLLQLYTVAGKPSAVGSDARVLAIFNAADLSLRYVTGLPAVENIGSFGKKTIVENDVIFIPVVTTDGSQPAIYVIDPATAVASRGTVVTCTGIGAVGKLRIENF
ncbi:MAG: DUF4374 domain-containing protein [Tannerella sp.]|jgi:hypothetical protein|nr:DUF4374 domain-containing protein [Tannerella sp.]